MSDLALVPEVVPSLAVHPPLPAVPHPGVDLVPDGWCESVVIPWADGQETVADLRNAAATVDGLIAAYRIIDADTLELTKARRYLEVRWGELLGEGQRGEPGKKAIAANSPAGDLHRMERTRFRKLAKHREIVVEAIRTATDPDDLSRASLLNSITQETRRDREQTPAKADATLPDSIDGRISVLHGDFRERLMELEPGSVDLIVTDPPYPKEDLPLWYDLGEVAAKLLAPRGLLFAYAGQIFLPEVIARLSEHLTYGWTFALQLPGSGSRIMGRHIIQAWKPVLAFSTGTWPSGEWGDDWLISPSREKSLYEWQQNAAPAQRVIERYSAPDGLVVDPFLGVGSFGVAAKQVGRRFVGVELDPGRFEQAKAAVL